MGKCASVRGDEASAASAATLIFFFALCQDGASGRRFRAEIWTRDTSTGRVTGRRRAARERALPSTHAKTSGGTTPSYAGSPGFRMKWSGERTPSLP